MALADVVSDGFMLTVNLGSKNDQTRSVNYELTATNYADAVTAVGVIVPKLLAVSAGAFKGYNILARAIDPTYNRPTDTDAEGRDTARVTAYIDGNPFKKVTFGIPMPKIGIFLATAGENMDVIDIADADLLAYKAIWETGGQATISDGESIGNLVKGKRAA